MNDWTWGDCSPRVILGDLPDCGEKHAQLECSKCGKDLSYAAPTGEWGQYVLHIAQSVGIASA